MAQLKDTIIQGNASVTDSLLIGGPLHIYNNSLMLDSGNYYWNILGGYVPSANRTLTLPDTSGCIATIPTRNTAVGSANKPVYMTAQGQATACTTARSSVTSGFNSTNITSMTLQYERCGGIVMVTFDCVTKIQFTKDSWYAMYQLPSGVRPLGTNIRFACNSSASATCIAGQCNASSPEGTIYLCNPYGNLAASTTVRGFFGFMLF